MTVRPVVMPSPFIGKKTMLRRSARGKFVLICLFDAARLEKVANNLE